MVAEYIVKIGAATESDAKLGLSCFLMDRFKREAVFEGCSCPEGYEPEILGASATMNVVFGDIDLNHSSSRAFGPPKAGEFASARRNVPESTIRFATENAAQITRESERLSRDERLCSILSGGAYNTSYGRYIAAGGSRGMFSNHFITYIRCLFRLDCTELMLKTSERIFDLDEWILKPFDAMLEFGILRRFPHNPDERAYFDAVHAFAESALAKS